MRTIFLSLFGVLALLVHAQQMAIPSQMEINALPLWAQTMYRQPEAFATVESLFRQYYRTHPFVKTYHTQYYKRWHKANLKYVNKNGKLEKPNPEIIALRQKEYIAKQKNNRNSNWSSVGPYTNHSEFGEQGSNQTNIYSVDMCLSVPDVMYAGTEPGEVYKSIDAGEHWQSVSTELDFGSGVTAVEVNPNNPNKLFAGGRNGLYRSTDGALTWQNVLPVSDLWCNEILIHPSDTQLVFLAAETGLYRSSDGGTTWTPLFAQKTYDIKPQFGSASNLFMVKNNPTAKLCEFFRSTDFGLTWQQQSSGWHSSTDAARNDGGARIAVTPANPDRVYAYLIGESKADDYGYIGVYRSDDGGFTWTLPNGPAGGPYSTSHINLAIGWVGWDYHQGFYNCALMASPDNADEILVGGLNLYRSTDGGQTFNSVAGYVGGPINMHVDMQDFRSFGGKTIISCDGGIYTSDDFFHSQPNFKMSGIHGSDFWGFGSGWNEDVLVGGLYHNGNVAYHENYGVGQFLELGGGEAPTGYVNPGQNKKTYFSDIGGIWLPELLNGDIQNAALGLSPNESYWAAESSEMEFHPNCYQIAYLGKDHSIWKSNDGGASFSILHTFGTDTSAQVKYIEISSENPDIIYLTQQPSDWSDGKLWKTNDGGQTWAQLSIPSGQSRRMLISLDIANQLNLVLAYPDGSNGNKIYLSTNGGSTWNNITESVFNNESIQTILFVSGTTNGIYAATERSVYYYDATQHWSIDNSGLPLYTSGNILKPFYRDSKIRLATYGKGIWESALNETPTQPIARIMVDKLSQITLCELDSFYFDDYSVLNHNGASWQWTFQGGQPSSSTERNPSVFFATEGSHLAVLQITDANGFADSDSLTVEVNFFDNPTQVQEDFQAAFPPLGWQISNPEEDAQWSLSANAGGFGNSTQSAIFDNYNNDSGGNADDLTMAFDATTLSNDNSFLSFDVAYARWSAAYPDSLQVLVSTDCGQNFTLLYTKTGSSLATAPDYQDFFIPTSDQWRTDSVDLAAYIGESQLLIAFRNIGHYGNSIYIDHINLGFTTQIERPKQIAHVNIYPNPVRRSQKLHVSGIGLMHCKVFDLSGKLVGEFKAENTADWNVPSNLRSGTYLLHIETETQLINRKLVIQ